MGLFKKEEEIKKGPLPEMLNTKFSMDQFVNLDLGEGNSIVARIIKIAGLWGNVRTNNEADGVINYEVVYAIPKYSYGSELMTTHTITVTSLRLSKINDVDMSQPQTG